MEGSKPRLTMLIPSESNVAFAWAAYCGDALRMFEAMPKEEVQRITLEIAMLGAKGLSVTDLSIKHQLRSLPGDFPGLHLLCLEYVGFRIIDPTVDIGFDISAEYAEARRMHGKG